MAYGTKAWEIVTVHLCNMVLAERSPSRKHPGPPSSQIKQLHARKYLLWIVIPLNTISVTVRTVNFHQAPNSNGLNQSYNISKPTISRISKSNNNNINKQANKQVFVFPMVAEIHWNGIPPSRLTRIKMLYIQMTSWNTCPAFYWRIFYIYLSFWWSKWLLKNIFFLLLMR